MNKTVSSNHPAGPSDQPDNEVSKKIKIDAETRQLLIELKGGSQDAFQKIFYKWNRQIHAVLSKLLHSAADAEDITQDVFIKIWENREKIDTEKDIKNFLFLVARHTALKFIEKKKVRSEYLNNLHYDDQDPLTSLDIITTREIELKAQAIVDTMPEQRRDIYMLSYREQLDNAQISEKLHIPREKVAKELFLARKQLRNTLNTLLVFIISEIFL